MNPKNHGSLERAPSTSPSHPIHVVLFACALLSAPGCFQFQQHSIESGAWELIIESRDSNDSPDPKRVEVTVDWGAKGTEEILIQWVDPATIDDPVPKMEELSGRYEDGMLSLSGIDDNWSIKFFGEVQTPQAISGTVWGRGRQNDKNVYSGVWRLLKIPRG